MSVLALVDTRGGYTDLFDIFSPIGIGVFLLFTVLILAVVLRYRRRGDGDGDEGEVPPDLHENPKAEGAYVMLLAAVAAMLVYFTFHWMAKDYADLPGEPSSNGQTDAALIHTPRAAEQIRVTAARWNWRFDYPRERISQVGTGDKIPTLVVPQGNVRFRLSSVDVIHAFFIPYLRFKRDAFPERPTNFTLGFDELGFHHAWGECAEFCGLRHAYMQFNVQVLSRAAFRRWAAARRAGKPQQLTPMLNNQGSYS